MTTFAAFARFPALLPRNRPVLGLFAVLGMLCPRCGQTDARRRKTEDGRRKRERGPGSVQEECQNDHFLTTFARVMTV